MKAKKPKVKLIGRDGNAFAIIGACQEAARKAGMPADQIKTIIAEMMSSNYDNLLMVATKYFDVQ